jgi:hypothetical protein
VALNKHLVTLLKLVLVAGLMWFAFQQVPFDDHIRYRAAPDGDKLGEILEEVVVDIEGHWQAEPVRATVGPERAERTFARGPQPDGRHLEVVPGFLTYWRNLDVLLFVLGALCYFLTALVSGTRWWWLLRVNGTDVSLFETLRFTWIGIFFNSVMPGSVGGDLVKALYIMKRCPGHRVQVLVSVIVDRVLGLASLALLGAVVVLFALEREAFSDLALAIWGVMGAVALVGVIAFSKRLRSLVRLKALLERLPKRLGHVLRLVDQAVFFYRNHKGVITASLLAGVANHVLAVLSVVLIGNALGVGLPTFDYFVLIPIINIVSAVPIAPNGWGLGEYMYGYLFGLAAPAGAQEVMTTRGIALSVLYRLHLTLWSLLGGLFVLFEKDRVTKADIAREAALEAEDDRRDAVDPSAPSR